jgi:hypothetical protein
MRIKQFCLAHQNRTFWPSGILSSRYTTVVLDRNSARSLGRTKDNRSTKLEEFQSDPNYKVKVRPRVLRGLNYTLEEMDTERTFLHNSRIHVLLNSTWSISKTDRLSDHKTNLHQFKKSEIISSTFSDHNGVTQKVSSRTSTM